AADIRAPTPSAAAERAVPDRREVLQELEGYRARMEAILSRRIEASEDEVEDLRARMHPRRLERRIHERMQRLADHDDLLRRAALSRVQREHSRLARVRADLEGRDPLAILERGYCIVESGGRIVKDTEDLSPGERMVLRMRDGRCRAIVEEIIHDRDV
ncbi:MAG: exodeoxyribonuclease VII large subunit, partial [Methanomicrobiales archaeon]|nr:exodeoxyribonuclease VII large subunit [Methanomicrobiales archaeon]